MKKKKALGRGVESLIGRDTEIKLPPWIEIPYPKEMLSIDDILLAFCFSSGFLAVGMAVGMALKGH